MGLISKVVTMGAKEVVFKPMVKQFSEKKNTASSSSDSASTTYSFRNNKSASLSAGNSSDASKTELKSYENYPELWRTKIKSVASQQYSVAEFNLEMGDIVIICGQGKCSYSVFIVTCVSYD